MIANAVLLLFNKDVTGSKTFITLHLQVESIKEKLPTDRECCNATTSWIIV